MVYLTKKGLSAGVHRIVNEDAFCMALHRGGVDIVSPELLPFRQQVALWAERPMVGGMSGSMLHTSVFVPQRTYVALNPETWINSNQVMIDRLNGNFARTLYPEDGYARVDGPGSFHHHLQLVDPEGTAKAFLKAMREAESEARRRALRPARYRPAWRHS